MRKLILSGIYMVLALTGLTSTMAQEAKITLKPTSINFKNQPVGETSTGKTITLTNSSAVDLSRVRLAINGSDKRNFAIAEASDCEADLASRDKCNIYIVFTPRTTGEYEATVTVNARELDEASEVALTGTGVEASDEDDAAGEIDDAAGEVDDTTGEIDDAASEVDDASETTGDSSSADETELMMTPSQINFGNQFVDTSSDEQSVTLSNDSDAEVQTLSFMIEGENADEFATPSSTCETILAAGNDCVINITFTPTDTGDRQATLKVMADNVTAIDIPLMGQGVAQDQPLLKFDSYAVDFGSQTLDVTSEEQTINVSNEGVEPLTGIDISVGDNVEFEQSTTCGDTLESRENCTISVMFTPAVLGERQAQLTITSDATTSPDQISLMGQGEADLGNIDYPELGQSYAFDGEGNVIDDISATFKGGIAIEGGEFMPHGDVSLVVDESGQITGQEVEISGTIVADPRHVNELADIIVLGLYVSEDNLGEDNCDPEIGDYYMMVNSPTGYCSWDDSYCRSATRRANAETYADLFVFLWDNQLENLGSLYQNVPLSAPVTLSEAEGRVMFKGNFEATGHLCITYGYRLNDGTLVFNGEQPITIMITSEE
ncbi:MAG: choice-of-anchor D domain-containing protein [Pseudomonadota bacterium]|nr:choice-of-anchor D domain-containing protein [Pseudomonadota bacterium]